MEKSNQADCGVEISGWDSSERFFVAKTLVPWKGTSEKQVTLQQKLHPGCLVFVRVLPASTGYESCPVAYRADVVEGADGSSLVQLLPVRLNSSPGPNSKN